MLYPLYLYPIFSILCIIFCTRTYKQVLFISLTFSIYSLIHVYILMLLFDHSIYNLYQFNTNNILGIDGISLWFIWLVNMLMPIVILSSVKLNHSKTFIILLLSIGFWCNSVFIILDLLGFYISFEGVLIPMYLFINLYGTRNRKVSASYNFILYTICGSLLLFVTIIYLYLLVGSTNHSVLYTYSYTGNIIYYLWLCFFICLMIKIPMIPFHIWLPEAHVESPTAGSVLLAGILLKLGSYGFIRYCISLFGVCSLYFTPLIYTISIIGIIYSLFACLSLWDIKKIIAYSSIAHMNLAILALFTNDIIGIVGGIYFNISHGLISSGLFLLIGVLYDRYHTRTILYFGGFVSIMPIFTLIFTLFTLGNIAFPGSSGFISEFLTFIGIFKDNIFIGLFSCLSIILSPIFSLWILHKICYGNFSNYIPKLYNDLTVKEFNLLFPLILYFIFFGFFPNIILSFIQPCALLCIY